MTGAPSSAHRAQDVLDFWFGPDPLGADHLPNRLRQWFGGEDPPEVVRLRDEVVVDRFAPAMEAALAGELHAWAASPRRLLALILLLDTFPRHAWRGRSRAFAGDAQALQRCVSGLATGADAALAPAERFFFYMPLQHAESPELQQESLAAYRRLAADAPAQHAHFFRGALQLATRNQQVVERFGRFPHRNAVLGRVSTGEELVWLRGERD